MELTVFDIVVGVLVGNLLTLSVFWGLWKLRNEQSEAEVIQNSDFWPYLAIAMPLLLSAATFYIAT